MTLSATPRPFDLKDAIADNRLIGVWRLMTGYRSTYIWAILSLGVAALARTGSMLLLGYYVDNVLGRADRSQFLPLVALGFVLLALLQGGFTFLSGKLAAQTVEGTVRRLRNYLFDHIQRLSFTYHDHTPTGELIQRGMETLMRDRTQFRHQLEQEYDPFKPPTLAPAHRADRYW